VDNVVLGCNSKTNVIEYYAETQELISKANFSAKLFMQQLWQHQLH